MSLIDSIKNFLGVKIDNSSGLYLKTTTGIIKILTDQDTIDADNFAICEQEEYDEALENKEINNEIFYCTINQEKEEEENET